MIITAYRIVKKEYAGEIWTGRGARDFGGRWNSKGVLVIYTAQSHSLAALEQLVHLVKPRVLKGYIVGEVEFDDGLVHRLGPADLPPGWDDPVAPSALKRIGDAWVAAAKFPVLGVPSAVIPSEWNYLINPGHPRFAGLPKSAPKAFAFDHRLD